MSTLADDWGELPPGVDEWLNRHREQGDEDDEDQADTDEYEVTYTDEETT